MNVIITGASKGIGRSIAEAFAAEGASLFLCARNKERLNETVAALQKKFPGSHISAKPVDLSIKEDT